MYDVCLRTWGRNVNMMYDVFLRKMKQSLIDEEDVYLVFLELRCFSSMLPSMPNGDIISMNVDAITMGEHCRKLI